MTDYICKCDRHQYGKEHRSNLQRLDTPAVKVERQKADRHVQKLAGNFVAVNETAVTGV